MASTSISSSKAGATEYTFDSKLKAGGKHARVRPIWTKAQFLEKAKEGEPLVVYRGQVVDLGGFVHPGGDILLGNGVVGTDVTLTVDRVHALDKKVQRVIHYRTIATLDDPDALLCQEDKDLRDLSERVTLMCNQPPFNSIYDNYLQLLHPFGAALIGLGMFALDLTNTGYTFMVLAHLKLFWWLHDAGHHGFFESKNTEETISDILALIFFGTPVHQAYREHEIHHAFVNCWDRDWVSLNWLFDLRRPVGDESKKLPLWLGVCQALGFLLGVNLFYFIHASSAIPEKFRTIKYKWSLALFLIVRHFVFWRLGGWQCYAVVVAAFGGAAFISCLNHIHMHKYDHPKDPRRPKSHLRQQVEQTQSTNSGFLWSWVSGYLDHHIEHHLFPNVPSHRLPGLKKDTKELLAKHNIHYNVVPAMTVIQLTLSQFVNPSRDTTTFSLRNKPTLLQKIQRQFDIYLWGTFVIDFLITIVFYVVWWNALVDKLQDKPVLLNVAATSMSIIILTMREGIHMFLFSEFIPAAKLNEPIVLKDLMAAVVTICTIASVLYFLNCANLLKIEPIQYQLNSLGMVIFEFFLMHMSQDLFLFKYVHEWMHHNFHVFKVLHSFHHSSRKTLHGIHSIRFHPLDLIIENTSGPFIAIAFWWALGYSDVRVLSASFFFLFRAGFLDHSCNLHTCVTGLPVYDQIFKYALVHNIHHALPSTNMTVIPWHHISSEKRAADYALYHSLLPLEEEFDYDRKNKL